MTQVAARAERGNRQVVPVRIVDADVHTGTRSEAEIRDYIPAEWRARNFPASIYSFRVGNVYTTPGSISRTDAIPANGLPAGSDPALLERQLFGEAGVDMAILLPLAGHPMPNPEHEAAVAASINSWLAETWLGAYNRDGRFRGSIRVCSTDPGLAVAEIEKWAGHPGFVQVMLTPYALTPLGHPSMLPVFEAAVRHGLPVAMHVTRSSGTRLMSPVGHASYYLEHHGTYPILYWTHLASMVFGGVFDSLPALRLVIVEGGVAWLAPLTWRMDRYWSEFRSELPHVRRRPSESIAEQVFMTSQPIEEPADQKHLIELMDWLGARERLMFSTDYPHWDFDDPDWVSRRLAKADRETVMAENAIRLYGLPRELEIERP